MKTKNCYNYPFEENVLMIAVSDPKAHYGAFKYAIDFLFDYATTILAAADGVVVDTKDNSNEGGLDEKFKDIKYQDYITIKHENGEFSQYVHLAKSSIIVKEGEEVVAGQPIAKGIDVVGYSGAPHLHFMVFKLKNNKDDFESIPIRWRKSGLKIYDGEGLGKQLKRLKYKNLLKLIIESQNRVTHS